MKNWQGEMFIRVITYIVASDSDEPEQTRVINYSDPEAREWLAKHQFWAWANGRSIELINIVDDVK